MTKMTMAEITQVEAQDDANELTQIKNKICDYYAEKGSAILFKDGSMLEPMDEYLAGTCVISPKKEVEVSLNEVYKGFNAGEDGYVLTIMDQAGSNIIESRNHYNIRALSLSEGGEGFLYETDSSGESMSRMLNKAEVEEHLEEIGYSKDAMNTLKNVIEEKNDEVRNRSVVDFLKEKLGFSDKPKSKAKNISRRKLR